MLVTMVVALYWIGRAGFDFVSHLCFSPAIFLYVRVTKKESLKKIVLYEQSYKAMAAQGQLKGKVSLFLLIQFD